MQIAAQVIKFGIALPSQDQSTFAPVLLCHSININFSHIYVETQLLLTKLYSKKENNRRNLILTLVAMKPSPIYP